MTKIKKSQRLQIRRNVAFVAFSCMVIGQAYAQSTTTTLNMVVVSGSRNEQPRDDLPLSMDVFSDRDMEDKQIGDIKELVKDLPNVSVKHAPARFGVTGASNSTGRDGNAGFQHPRPWRQPGSNADRRYTHSP
jgi:hemoglobin/transferrin/lactoferrin receptor protein